MYSSSSSILFNLTLSLTMNSNWSSNISFVPFSSSSPSSMMVNILLGTLLSLIALLTSIGNIIVLLAFYYDRNLRTINDYFILNMAIADFLVGFFCIPFYIPFSLTDLWPFGRFFCKIWLTIDDVSTMASVINIVAISVNRYWSIAYPISYRKYVRKHFVYLVMSIIWFISFLNFAPGIWLLNLFETSIDESLLIECSGDYTRSFVYMLIAQFNYFIWPFFLLCLLNLLIMLNIWKRTRRMTRLRSEENETNRSIDVDRDDKHLSILNNENKVKVNLGRQTNVGDRIDLLHRQDLTKNFHQIFSFSTRKQENSFLNVNEKTSQRRERRSPHCSSRSPTPNRTRPRPRPGPRTRYQSERSETMIEDPSESELTSTKSREIRFDHRTRQRDLRINRDRRAARSLFILVLIFLIFLFPYVVCATIATAGVQIPSSIFHFSFWLLWLNSTFNPLLYPFIQLKYRRAYRKLFDSMKKHLSFRRENLFF